MERTLHAINNASAALLSNLEYLVLILAEEKPEEAFLLDADHGERQDALRSLASTYERARDLLAMLRSLDATNVKARELVVWRATVRLSRRRRSRRRLLPVR